MRFSDQVAIVTAAAGAGIGQATARALAMEGATVVIADQHPKRTREVSRMIKETYRTESLGIVCDVTEQEQIENVVKRTIDEFGKIDILVNNAGFDVFKPLEEMDVYSIKRVIDINLMATILITKEVIPWMKKRNQGKIVNLSSVAAYSPDSGDSTAYCAAKAAIQAFTRTLAREVGKYNIRVNAIAPSVTLNPFLEKQMPAEAIAELMSKMPLGAIKPDEQAKAILFLLSDDARLISGATLNVTAGY
jgi:3-oxoacyl-[acyl-carrier protein] reductase